MAFQLRTPPTDFIRLLSFRKYETALHAVHQWKHRYSENTCLAAIKCFLLKPGKFSVWWGKSYIFMFLYIFHTFQSTQKSYIYVFCYYMLLFESGLWTCMCNVCYRLLAHALSVFHSRTGIPKSGAYKKCLTFSYLIKATCKQQQY